MDYGISQRKLKAGALPLPLAQCSQALPRHSSWSLGPQGSSHPGPCLLKGLQEASATSLLVNSKSEELFGAKAQTSVRCNECRVAGGTIKEGCGAWQGELGQPGKRAGALDPGDLGGFRIQAEAIELRQKLKGESQKLRGEREIMYWEVKAHLVRS